MLAPDDREKQQTNFRLKIYTSLQLFIYASTISKTNREPIPASTALLMLGIQNVVKSKILLTRRCYKYITWNRIKMEYVLLVNDSIIFLILKTWKSTHRHSNRMHRPSSHRKSWSVQTVDAVLTDDEINGWTRARMSEAGASTKSLLLIIWYQL